MPTTNIYIISVFLFANLLYSCNTLFPFAIFFVCKTFFLLAVIFFCKSLFLFAKSTFICSQYFHFYLQNFFFCNTSFLLQVYVVLFLTQAFVRMRRLNVFKKKTTLFVRKTYCFISSCDHGNIETALLLLYHNQGFSWLKMRRRCHPVPS